MVAGGRVELPSLAYETKLEPPPVYPAVSWFRQMESNHLMPPYQDGAHPESLAGKFWGRRRHLKSHDPLYRSGALPLKLQRRWCGNGAGEENRTLLASLEGWNSTNEPLPL